MKTIILAAFALITLSIGVANADPVANTSLGQGGTEYNLTAGAAGWG